ncbi:MAG: hypothetical protein JW809_10170 [Pirellulales bacterium]|nr:hypothetical protein [Pirellulales bacterium]
MNIAKPQRLWAPLVAAVGLCFLVLASSVSAQNPEPAAPSVPLKHHPWATFSPGAWKCVRVVTETFDEDGSVANTGVTETTTTLKTIDAGGVTLEEEVAVWVAGKRLDPQTQTVWQGLFGQSMDQKVTVKNLPPAEVAIEGRAIPCNVRQYEITGPDGKRVELVTVYSNDGVAPFVLRRQSVITGTNGSGTSNNLDMDVDALDMPTSVDDRVQTAAHTRTVHRHAKGTTLTLAYTSDEVPGGVISHESKDLDKQGRLVRRSVLQLLAFGLKPEEEPEDDRGGLLPRRLRSARLRKTVRQPSE